MPKGQYSRPPLAVRFWSRVVREPSLSGCWEWARYRNHDGYGVAVFAKSRNVLAHRLAWELAAGPVPDGFRVLHTCDNPPCVRNDDEGWYRVGGVLRPRRGHLWIGTQPDNMADMTAKGRASRIQRPVYNRANGERHAKAILTDEIVRTIRAIHAAGEVSGTELAARFGISKSLIWDVVHRRTWKHVIS